MHTIVLNHFRLPFIARKAHFNRQFFEKEVYQSRCSIFSVVGDLYRYLFFSSFKDIKEIIRGFINIPVNFNYPAAHLWFIYMIIGLYLLMPILSPWLNVASKMDKLGFLIIWIFTLFLPYLRLYSGQILGEAPWNNYSTVYYFSGFIGYLVLGHFAKTYINTPANRSRIIGAAMLIVGYLISYYGFTRNIGISKDIVYCELPWSFTSINIAIEAMGIFMLLKDISIKSTLAKRLIIQLADLTFGIYLVHYLILNALYSTINSYFSLSAVTIPVLAIITFMSSFFVIKIISYHPNNKYFIG